MKRYGAPGLCLMLGASLGAAAPEKVGEGRKAAGKNSICFHRIIQRGIMEARWKNSVGAENKRKIEC